MIGLVLLEYNVNIDSTFPKCQFFFRESIQKREEVLLLLLLLLWNINGDFHSVVT